MSAWQSDESEALAGEVWQESDNVLLLCVQPGVQWQDFNGHRFPWDAPTIARPLRRLLDRAGNLAPEYGKTRAPLGDPEPQPSDGPEYHAEHQAWLERQP